MSEYTPGETHLYRESHCTDDGEVLTVKSCLNYIEGNAKPYFSTTGEWKSKRGRIISCGCLHGDILTHFPHLEPLIDLHMSDIDGAPMHAEANGLFHLGVGKWAERNDPFAMSHFRVDTRGLSNLRFIATCLGEISPDGWKLVVDTMRPRWANEAKEGIAQLDAMIEDQAA